MFFSHLLSSFSDCIEIGEDEFYLYKEVWTEYATDFLTTVFLYTALALVVILIAAGITVKLRQPERMKSFLNIAVALVCGFAATVIVSMLALNYAKIAEKGYSEYDGILGLVLIPSTVLGGIAVLGVAGAYISSLFSKKAFKITLIVAASAFAATLIALLVCLAVYFANGTAEGNNGAEITVTENAVLYVSALAIILIIGLSALFFGRKEKKEFDSKSISYAAVCIATSFALSYIKFVQMPQGGSLTLASLLPIMIYAYMFGVKKGVIAGTVYGILQAVQDPWLIHPAQFLLDYPIAFASIGLVGCFSKIEKLKSLPQIQFTLGAIAASILRFASHVLSGVFAFSEYSTLDNVWAYSMAYNSFVFIDIAITIVAGAIAFSVKSFAQQVRRIQAGALIQPEKDSAQ